MMKYCTIIAHDLSYQYIGLNARNAMTFCSQCILFFSIRKSLRSFVLSWGNTSLVTLFNLPKFELISLDHWETVLGTSSETRWRKKDKNLRVLHFLLVFLRIYSTVAKLFCQRVIENTLVYSTKEKKSLKIFLWRVIFLSH